MFFNSRILFISVFIWNFLSLTCHAEDKVNRAKKDLEDLIAQASYGDKIETVRATQTENAAIPVKKSESRSIDSNRRRIPMRNRNPLMKLPPGVLIRPGTSMGLKSISFTNDTNTRTPDASRIAASLPPFDTKLLGQLKHLLPGTTNVEEIQDELDGLLFGQQGKSDKIEKLKKSIPIPDFAGRMPDLQESASQKSISASSVKINQAVIEGDRANYEEYDYNDYDLYAYDDEETDEKKKEHDLRQELQSILDQLNTTTTSTTTQNPLPTAEPQRQRRPGLRRRRIQAMLQNQAKNQNQNQAQSQNQNQRRPYFEDASSMDFGDYSFTPNRRVSALGNVEDDFQIYKGPGLNKIPGRIQTLNPYSRDDISSATFSKDTLGFQRRPALSKSKAEDCDYYTDSLCLDVGNYPKNEIMSLLSVNRRVGADLIADVVDQSADNLVDGVTAAQENRYTFTHYYGSRREDGPSDDNHIHRDFAQDGGFLCPSEIKYAKPKRGKTAQGVWKDIVNVNDYTQTLRMEKCMKPGGSCSYVSHHYKSQCSQVYNYHRLLSWDKTRGLHMDIYKVPSCCSCHIMGYSYVYPPLKSASSKSEVVEPLPTSPPALPPRKPKPSNSLIPKIDPPKEFQNFLENIGSSFNFAARSEKQSPAQGDMSSRPSVQVPRVRKRPLQKQQQQQQQKRKRQRLGGNLPRRRIDPGKSRNFLGDLMDMDVLGSETQETIVPNLNEDIASHRYESIPITNVDERSGKTAIADGDEVETEPAPSLDDIKDIKLPKVEQDESKKSINYGYHPIIDFFGNFRFDTA